ncbi:uncharacterized protein TRIVIDRAFT_206487 [Trichoderma virens Gv29-8]|uniref:Uncharacterized protein n=1 Tax=Hypocrea virens (strain Gv29-8 / FGSC 10586) TaxID=413071 RepID=G9NAE8_HYPVG|nr:uncharacterized protein TRIVIDRAFT_206487 [Trichoderma virens Gv29-8]EHK15809.1 hypothetical protein TRIVIDRAFT_206487 [Trichoderma virens Gv29-8]UKZ56419.1 hypothetical protein TrVGV298_010255 [Trichoderma virens]
MGHFHHGTTWKQIEHPCAGTNWQQIEHLCAGTNWQQIEHLCAGTNWQQIGHCAGTNSQQVGHLCTGLADGALPTGEMYTVERFLPSSYVAHSSSSSSSSSCETALLLVCTLFSVTLVHFSMVFVHSSDLNTRFRLKEGHLVTLAFALLSH